MPILCMILVTDLHTSDSADAFRPGHVTKTNSCGWIRDVPEKLRDIRYMRPAIPYFYKKYTEAYGIPVIGTLINSHIISLIDRYSQINTG